MKDTWLTRALFTPGVTFIHAPRRVAPPARLYTYPSSTLPPDLVDDLFSVQMPHDMDIGIQDLLWYVVRGL